MKTESCVVEVFSRVTGFFRPVKMWNKGKIEEFRQRSVYDGTFEDKRGEGNKEKIITER